MHIMKALRNWLNRLRNFKNSKYISRLQIVIGDDFCFVQFLDDYVFRRTYAKRKELHMFIKIFVDTRDRLRYNLYEPMQNI